MADKMITFRSTEEFHRHMKFEAHRLSIERQEDLNVTDLIREALFERYPMSASIKNSGGIDENGEKRK